MNKLTTVTRAYDTRIGVKKT